VPVDFKNALVIPQCRGRVNLIFLSNIILEKGIFDLLDALDKINDDLNVTLRVYGEFHSQEIRNKFFSRVDLNENVIYGGVIFGDCKYRALRASDAFILPSHNEGQPISIIEAMSMGLPIITTRVGLISEMLPSGYPLVSQPHDVN
ncbi:glycosyltransferase family 4 protein, partial [Vibrio rotiferianus]